MDVERLGEWELAGETKVFGANLLQFHIVHQKSQMTYPGIEHGQPPSEASDKMYCI
jgi:hypothetical protein